MDTLKKGEELLQDDLLNQDTKKNLPYERLTIDGTPFVVIREPLENDKYTYILTLGRYSLGNFESKEEAIKDAYREDWNRIIQVIMLVVNNELKEK